MKDVTLTNGELHHLETIHRHGRDPATKNVVTSILSRTNETDGTDVIYETICNHDGKREATEREKEDANVQSGWSLGYVCDDCGTTWDSFGRVMKQQEDNC